MPEYFTLGYMNQFLINVKEWQLVVKRSLSSESKLPVGEIEALAIIQEIGLVSCDRVKFPTKQVAITNETSVRNLLFYFRHYCLKVCSLLHLFS
jgi:hypothetical protein